MNTNSKINTVLLVIVIILLVIGISILLNKKTHVLPQSLPATNVPVQNTESSPQAVSPAPTGTPELDMSSPYVKTYKGLFTQEFAKPANFDGHFRVVAVGCGSGCMYLYALDKNTGEAYKISATDTQSNSSITNEAYSNYTLGGNQITVSFPDGDSETVAYDQASDSFKMTLASD